MASTLPDSTPAAATSVRPHWWLALAGRLLRPWVRIKRDPAEPATLLDAHKPVCYVVERHGLSDTLILERACREAGLPSPYASIGGLAHPRNAMFSLSHRVGRLIGRTRRGASQARLRQLLSSLEVMPEADVQLVPVAIYVGRAPGRESGWFRVLFSEDWVVVGRFRRILALLLNGRDTVVHFSRPVSMREVLAESGEERTERTARKIARVLRTHFRRIRAAVIGPDLSHKRTVVDSVLNAAPVREAIDVAASKDGISRHKAMRRAHDMMMEIAADYKHTVVRSASFILAWFWNKLYDGISMHHFDRARDIAPGHEVIYVPCHRSHADYVLLSYKLQAAGVVVPHIAAGKNLNLPVLGRFLRGGGAFFMRRSFRGSALYSTIFKEYMAQLIDRGVPLEYFIEGGRSRTGRLLKPHAGMLSMTVRAFLRAPRRPVLFQPVYIGYEKLMEGKSYVGELSGQPKEKESWLALLRGVRKILKQHYGHVALSFGEPVELNEVLDACAADWREHADLAPDAKPEWLSRSVDHLAESIHININACANVNPVNLLALVLLSTRKHAVAESDLLAQLELFKALLTELPYAERVSVTRDTAEEIVAHGEAMGWIRRVSHPQGDVLVTEGEQAVLLSYFRNNVLHLVAAAAWVASCFLNNRRMSRASILRLGRIIYPFIQSELFLRWTEAEFVDVLSDTLDFFVRRGLLDARSEGRVLERGPGQDDGAFQLKTVARTLMQAFERYYIVIATLVGHEAGTLSASELEKACTLTAQRVSLLHELSAPEFFDKALFRGFIHKLRQRRVIWSNDAGKLEYDAALESVVEDARVVLSRELRHSVLKMTAGEPSAAP
ncbi:MAG TPA: glycerol-3-phosphate 1-O-acyltransferase PlsB [Oleiagrimonas sp.]|nr:glycerol-3-phosphate 1-O-acyltransferase PlsB [Oleiagrimonas sp.]